MKKIFFVFFLLAGCMGAPQKSFQVDPDTGVYTLAVGQIEVVPMAAHFDMLPHVENKMPTSPEEAVQEWAQNHLQATGGTHKKLWIIVNQAEMLKTNLPSNGFFKLDEESYTLNYRLSVQVREGDAIIQDFPVDGKGFVTLKKKAALASKEKGWAWLIQKMLTHLKTKMQTELKEVFVE
ncbi:MAG: hypothetical protein ACI4OR_02335 [Alphaproteobacteria bacterium]